MIMKSFSSVAVLVLLAGPVLAQQKTDGVNPTSDLGVELPPDTAFQYLEPPEDGAWMQPD